MDTYDEIQEEMEKELLTEKVDLKKSIASLVDKDWDELEELAEEFNITPPFGTKKELAVKIAKAKQNEDIMHFGRVNLKFKGME